MLRNIIRDNLVDYGSFQGEKNKLGLYEKDE